jgi:hypothetical protein
MRWRRRRNEDGPSEKGAVKKFAFRLDRVLAWRRAQEHVAEAMLERLHTDVRALEFQQRTLGDECSRAVTAVTGARAITGSDLAALDAYRRSATAQASRLAASRLELDGRIAAQVQEVANRSRDVRLIERLREQKFQKWRLGFLTEIERQAEETHSAKFNQTRERSEASRPELDD